MESLVGKAIATAAAGCCGYPSKQKTRTNNSKHPTCRKFSKGGILRPYPVEVGSQARRKFKRQVLELNHFV